MEVYFYCSYEHSQKGFFMTRLDNDRLVPVETVPETVESFFSYDHFQVLWHDLCGGSERKLWKPHPYGMFFGLRNLQGEMEDGRRCTANIVMVANFSEMAKLRRIALSILGDYPGFKRQLTGWLRIGGHSYELNTGAFTRWMESCAGAASLHRLAAPKSKASNLLSWMQRVEEPRLETELLRLAVYTSSWKDLQIVMGQGMAWKVKHPCALTPEEFEDVFINAAPLWELSADS